AFRPAMTRREFVGAVASMAAFTVVPRHVLGGPGKTPPSEKLNIACIGAGGRGYYDAMNVSTENIVALCDVDDKRAAATFERFSEAKRYHDFRKMLEKEDKSIDAVVVATADHTHIPISVMAMKMGKHCYCEKPMGHNIHEVRAATEVARRYGLATQLGNGAHSGYNYRSMVALIKAGTIGEVKEVHCWCDQSWPTGDRPKDRPPVPKHLKWDLWLGPAPVRPYHPTYHPLGWRSWWDFGNGRLGDMGCHMIDLPFTALDLKYPLTVETESSKPAHEESAPAWLISKWTFPKRGDLPPVDLTWYDGGKRPPLQKQHNMPDWPEATIFVGSKGMLIADYGRFKLYPEEKFAGVRRPQLPRGLPHAQEWIKACKTGGPTGSHFGYSGPLTETVLLGTVAYSAGRKLQWDPVNLKATNCREADQFIRRTYREGWTL
ncbi:MAG: Gfo/Idh/MocA family oxidoreductase, partial [Planctomycetota bacterium]|nr:Gfo/Idh/MocA family oxidoreductase [Planctomycetota bacterium]